MHKPSVGVAPEGYPFLVLLAVSSLIFALIDCWPMSIILLAALWLGGHFFRDPERVIPQAEGLAVSPADGRVIRIEKRANPFGDGERVCVSIFMNLFDVHVNRSPVAGKVEQIVYTPGKFINASLDKASDENERCAWRIQSDTGEIWDMVQIAGLVARRIVARAEVGDSLARGERYGLIRFGSRVDVYLPENYSAAVALNSVVAAGETVLATRIKDEERA